VYSVKQHSTTEINLPIKRLRSNHNRLMNSGGSLLAFAAASDREARIYAAIAANLWSTYLKSAMPGSSFRNEADGDDLRILILPCEEGVVAVAAPSTMLLCLVGDSTIELGLLKAKVIRLKRFSIVRVAFDELF
jgi:hypothetical protein